MRKKLFILTVVSLMVCLIGFVGFASACDDDHDGKSKQRHLDLYQKCRLINNISDPNVPFCTPGDAVPVPPLNDLDLDPVTGKGRAWGKMEYKSSDKIFKFEFEGHKLTPEESYTLIYFPKWNSPWGAGLNLIYFGSDIADRGGNVHINGSLDTGDLPLGYDEDCINADQLTGRCGQGSGARIWLVLSSDICFRSSFLQPRMIGWNPALYLFGDNLISFTDTHFDPENPCETNCELCY
jgi:hypothetical protein